MQNEQKQHSIILYSTGCPRCSVLEKKLTQLGIIFEKNTSIKEMVALGIAVTPMLQVDGDILDFNNAIKWLNNYYPEVRA